ncbi:MAG: FtsW/RodA/SpoVE family cell cycle protein [Chloroflexi bacterium]|nr:FtsW/RodA/SpoVE family cell cycle protein [Chloroflexota bacterium]
MGKPTAMKNTLNPSEKRQTARKFSIRGNFDIPLTVIVITLFAFGLLMVYSASWQFAQELGNSEYGTVLRQMGYGLAGMALAAFLTFFDYHRFRKWVVPGMITIMVLLIGVLLFGQETEFGAKRGLFAGSIQPSEFAKLMIIIYLSFWLDSKRDSFNQLSIGLIPLAAIVGITAGLILAQPDVSAAATVVLLGGVLFYNAGGKLRQILIILGVTAVLGFLVVRISSTASTRLNDYWNGLQNPEQASDHVKWSLEAIINGGIFGVGIGRSTTKFIGLPVAPTDSIFAVIAEETGLLGAFFLLLLYVAFLWRGLTIAHRAKDDLGKGLASGITLWIVIEAAINTGVLVNLLPFAGNALPLISAGGSNLVTTFAGIGVLLGIARQSKLEAPSTSERTSPHAVVDLRRGDRRRSVPRPVRPTGNR